MKAPHTNPKRKRGDPQARSARERDATNALSLALRACGVYRREIVVALVLVAVTFAVYWPVQRYGFLAFDDKAYVVENPWVKAGLTWTGLGWAFTSFEAANWHPLTWLSLQIDAELSGSPGAQDADTLHRLAQGCHTTNVLLHAATVVLLFAALRRMTGAVWPSAVVAALFAWHPLHVESVAWIAERKDVLSGLFWMLTLLLYAGYVQKPDVVHYLAVVVSLALGLLAKPMLVTLPCVLLLLDFWPLGRMPVAGAKRPVPWRWLVVEKLPLFALVIASCVVTFLAQQRGQAVASLEHVPLDQRIANAVVSYAVYLRNMVWPVNLVVFYPLEPLALTSAPVLIASGVLVALTAVVVWQRRQRPYLLVGWLWYLGTLVPVIGIVQVGMQALADRYTYIPLVGVGIALAWLGADLARSVRGRIAVAVAAGAALLACLVLTPLQIGYWEDDSVQWKHVLKSGIDTPQVRVMLASLAREANDDATALEHIGKGLASVETRKPLLHHELGLLLWKQGKVPEAIAAFEEEIRRYPSAAKPYQTLGLLYEGERKLDDAAHCFQQALAASGGDAFSHAKLAEVLTKQKKYAEAAEQWEAALHLDALSPLAQFHVGVDLRRQHRLDEAIAHLRRAVELDTKKITYRCYLAHALAEAGLIQEATAAYAEVNRRDGQWQAHTAQRAWTLATYPDGTVRDGAQAVELAEQVNQASGYEVPVFLDTLAAACAEQGDFAAAVKAARNALARLGSSQPRLAAEIQARLQHYEKKEPIRDPSMPPPPPPR
jgi:predicted Zn-dependent protease